MHLQILSPKDSFLRGFTVLCIGEKYAHCKVLYFLPFWCKVRKSPLTALFSLACT